MYNVLVHRCIMFEICLMCTYLQNKVCVGVGVSGREGAPAPKVALKEDLNWLHVSSSCKKIKLVQWMFDQDSVEF